ncbi:hypothetical protein A5704_07245 [Mycobacterium sp. E735]|nr:hypothetical protein A5704_07245 [Mycobacterium sp. E735]
MSASFSPVQLGPATLRNPIIKAATSEGRSPQGLVTDDLIAFHRAFADGGVGMTTVAYCCVAPEGASAPAWPSWAEMAAPAPCTASVSLRRPGSACELMTI